MALSQSFYAWVIFHCIYVLHLCWWTFSVDGHFGCLHVLTVVNSTAMNTGVHVPFWIMFFSGSAPRSGITGTYNICVLESQFLHLEIRGLNNCFLRPFLFWPSLELWKFRNLCNSVSQLRSRPYSRKVECHCLAPWSNSNSAPSWIAKSLIEHLNDLNSDNFFFNARLKNLKVWRFWDFLVLFFTATSMV